MAKILIVEDDTTFANTLHKFLSKHGHEPLKAFSAESARAAIDKTKFDLLLLDYRLADGTGLDVLEYARSKNYTKPVVFMTRYHDVSVAVNAMRMGAYNFITKPIHPDEFILVINEALESESNTSNYFTKAEKKPVNTYVTGTGECSKQLEKHINIVAPTNMSIIIQGESGTGKEYVARAIHSRSPRAEGAFIAVDCGILSGDLAPSELFGHVKGSFTGAHTDKKGVFESAHHGTLFLDEVGNLNIDVQAKLLRALQERVVLRIGSTKSMSVDVRIICATNEDLKKRVLEGGFREDLYHRLNEFKITCEPLRNRQEDLDIFIEEFIAQANQDLSKSVVDLSQETKDALREYHWPGNLRELRNVIRRCVLLAEGDIAEKSALPPEMLNPVKNANENVFAESESDLHAIKEKTERELILSTLIKVNYNKSMAARLLNIDRKTLYNKIDQYEIDL